MSYDHAFGLTDNPFCPAEPFLDLGVRYRKRLSSSPLLLHEESKLMPLYCEAIDAKRHFDDFERRIAAYNFRTTPSKALGTETFAFVVHGSKGSGKTTLVNRMISHMKDCAPNGTAWKLYGQWPEDNTSTDWQLKAIDEIRDAILGEHPEYACVVFDDLTAGAETAAANLFHRVDDEGIVIFAFLVTSNVALIKRDWAGMRLNPRVYSVDELSPEAAVEYIAARLNVFRSKSATGRFGPLYPFDEQDITEALTEQAIGRGAVFKGAVTLRVLNGTLCDALFRRKDNPPSPGETIKLATAYKEELAA